jgi:stage V sporulation protein AE
MDYINAFWIGGLICAIVQILMDRTKLMPGRIMVLLVCSGAVLGALGIYEPRLYSKCCRDFRCLNPWLSCFAYV